MPHPVTVLALIALIPFEKDGKWGYRDNAGKVMISPRFDVADEFSREGIAAVVDDRGWAYVDRGGRTVIRPLVVDNGPDPFRDGVARFRQEGKVGFFDRRGKIVIPPAFAYAMPFAEGRAAVCDGCREVQDGEHRLIEGGNWGFIDRTGFLVIPLRFSEVRDFENGRARVRTGATWQYIARDGKPAPQSAPVTRKEKTAR